MRTRIAIVVLASSLCGAPALAGAGDCVLDCCGQEYVGIADLTALLSDWGLDSDEWSYGQDANGDDVIDLIDLLALLAEWGVDGCPGWDPYVTKWLWVDQATIRDAPRTGEGWEDLQSRAEDPLPASPAEYDLGDLTEQSEIIALAKSMLAEATRDDALAGEVRDFIDEVVVVDDYHAGANKVLGLCRNLASIIIAADLVGFDGEAEYYRFEDWLEGILAEDPKDLLWDGGGGCHSLIECHSVEPTNFGTMAGSSRLLAHLFLEDGAGQADTIGIFRMWLGEDPGAHERFVWHARECWHADTSDKRGINPAGAVIDGLDVDGVLPEEQRRCCRKQCIGRCEAFAMPECDDVDVTCNDCTCCPSGQGPVCEGYPWEALQGAVATAWIIDRNTGADPWSWADDALLRAVQWLYTVASPDCGAHGDHPEGGGQGSTRDDEWMIFIINMVYESAAETPFDTEDIGFVAPGKQVGFTDWTHAAGEHSP